MKELYQRFKADTPLWFKRIRRVGLAMVAISSALLAANGNLGFILPVILSTACQWITVAGITAAAVSTTAKK